LGVFSRQVLLKGFIPFVTLLSSHPGIRIFRAFVVMISAPDDPFLKLYQGDRTSFFFFFVFF